MNRDEAIQRANERRTELAEVRRRARAGEVTIAELLSDPPACVERHTLVDVVRLGYSTSGTARGSATVEQLGRDALRDGVNLLVPVERASQRSREWVAERAGWERWRSRRGVKAGQA